MIGVSRSEVRDFIMSKKYIVVAECGGFTGAFLDDDHDLERDQTIGRLTSQADSYAEALQLVGDWIENLADLDGLIIWPRDEPLPPHLRSAR